MVVLLLFGLVWVVARVAVALRLALVGDEPPGAVCVQDRPAPQDAVDLPQDATTVPVASSLAPEPTATTSTSTSATSSPEGASSFRETVVAAVARPSAGPSFFGGRDDAAYLSGWDAAVDWVGKGQDATPPTWGDVAYMTGWYDGMRDVSRARRRHDVLWRLRRGGLVDA